MSQERSGREGSPQADPSTSRPGKSRKSYRSPKYQISDKVFAHPEYRVPFQLAVLTKGRGHRALQGRPLGWLEMAVRSGLAEMDLSPRGATAEVQLLEPLPGHPPARMRPLSEVLAEGLARTLLELDELGKKK